MNKRLFWKLCLIIATGVVGFFYLMNIVTERAEEGMSMLAPEHRAQLNAWGAHAEQLYNSGNQQAVEQWLAKLKQQENTWAAIVEYQFTQVAGDPLEEVYSERFYLGRSVDWKIHLYFNYNPVMDIPFSQGQTSFLIKLPTRMRPGSFWPSTRILLEIIIPMLLLSILSWILYHHIANPLKQLEKATREFSKGNFQVRVRHSIGKRNDEIAQLAETFDRMALRIGDLINSQRQLISDLSHELRTPLTRLDIAVLGLQDQHNQLENLQRVERESRQIRKLVDDTLTLAWLENEQPKLQKESLDLVDLIDVIVEDAKFEFPHNKLTVTLPNSAKIANSHHRAIGQALENVLRNALRYTPIELTVELSLRQHNDYFTISVSDQGPGVPENMLQAIFQPFFRVDKARIADSASFGLGLALARRQIHAVGGTIEASNKPTGGLLINIQLPQNARAC
ncbi:integral membrane sensor signal transduction histidine kinase [Catenovulum agarivorans DS-2]|uniref:histidine kinase n=1 Tax=Catenovulum agarivorans DS-2 TaxID=1328313 RepID=W7QDW7_9ALTE|nr:sensor histidine kinase [Catenovulum agarivorans]EWH11079.1 integral membrane sensor signal transduction histidine kinase [Catenovulum agarivorans DS-2]